MSAFTIRNMFIVLGLGMVFTLIYTISLHGHPFHKHFLTPFMVTTLIDFYINVIAIGAWICYKESNWINAFIWIILLICFGSVTTCGYIVLQFFNLSASQSSLDPVCHVLTRQFSKNEVPEKSCLSLIGAKVFFSSLGCFMLGTLLYTLLTDGFPFRLEIFTPWTIALLVDFYINVTALSVWVAYKESSWMSAMVWIVLLICLGSITTCLYIVRQLFYLSSQDPVYLVLLNSSNRKQLQGNMVSTDQEQTPLALDDHEDHTGVV